MIAGLVVKSRPFGTAVKPASAIDVHRFVTTLALGGIVVHILTLVLDSTIEIGLGASSFRGSPRTSLSGRGSECSRRN